MAAYTWFSMTGTGKLIAGTSISAGMLRTELRRAILRWIDLTQQLEQVGHQLGRIKDQYADLQFPDEIESLAELEPIDRRKRVLAARERDLRSQSCRLGNEQAALDDQIRATLPIDVWIG